MLPTGTPSLALISVSRHGRLVDEQGKQLLAARGQVAECLTQRCVTFRHEPLLLGHRDLMAGLTPGSAIFPAIC